MPVFSMDNQDITYEIIYQKRRKTITLKILSDSRLEITAPAGTSPAYLAELLHQKQHWLRKKLAARRQLDSNPLNKTILPGANLLYLGVPHTLVFTTIPRQRATVSCQDNQLIVSLTERQSDAAAVLERWYIKTAGAHLQKSTIEWARRIGVTPKRLALKDQKTRWGSCSSAGNINYNWRIIMAPPAVIDYLVIHELCHLRFPNHSQEFWQEVAAYCPAFHQHRQWLKTNGALLSSLFRTSL